MGFGLKPAEACNGQDARKTSMHVVRADPTLEKDVYVEEGMVPGFEYLEADLLRRVWTGMVEKARTNVFVAWETSNFEIQCPSKMSRGARASFIRPPGMTVMDQTGHGYVVNCFREPES